MKTTKRGQPCRRMRPRGRHERLQTVRLGDEDEGCAAEKVML